MKATLISHCIVGASIAAMLLLMGCGGSTPSRLYALSTENNVTGSTRNDVPPTPYAIGIRTLRLPEYLLRQQIVTRSGNKIVLAEFDRWAEPLEANFKRVLTEDLSRDIPTNNIFLFPAKDTSVVNYQLLLEVTEFEFAEGGNVTLAVRWGLEQGERIAFLMDKRSSFTERSGNSYEEMVAAMSRLIGKLSKEIAIEIRGQVITGR